MTMLRAVPARTALTALGGLAGSALLALLAGVPEPIVSRLTLVAFAAIAAAAVADYALTRRAWRRASAVMRRTLPAAFAIGVKRPVEVTIESQGARTWRCDLHDHADATLLTDGLPVRIAIEGGKRVAVSYVVTPTARGKVRF